MHDIKTFTKTPLNKLKNLCIGDKIELLTYKKDRKITIIKKDLAIYNVIESEKLNETLSVNSNNMKEEFLISKIADKWKKFINEIREN